MSAAFRPSVSVCNSHLKLERITAEVVSRAELIATVA